MREEKTSGYNKMKSIIVEKGMKQQQVAERIGMDRSVFNTKINRNMNRDFTLQEACKIAYVLQVRLDDFF